MTDRGVVGLETVANELNDFSPLFVAVDERLSYRVGVKRSDGGSTLVVDVFCFHNALNLMLYCY